MDPIGQKLFLNGVPGDKEAAAKLVAASVIYNVPIEKLILVDTPRGYEIVIRQ